MTGGPNTETAEPQTPVSLTAWHWPLILRAGSGGLLIECGRGMCRAPIADLSPTEALGWKVDVADLTALALDHLQHSCMSGRLRQ